MIYDLLSRLDLPQFVRRRDDLPHRDNVEIVRVVGDDGAGPDEVVVRMGQDEAGPGKLAGAGLAVRQAGRRHVAPRAANIAASRRKVGVGAALLGPDGQQGRRGLGGRTDAAPAAATDF